MKASAVAIEAEHNQAVLQMAADAELAADGLIADLALQLSRVRENELERRMALEQQRIEISADSTRAHWRRNRPVWISFVPSRSYDDIRSIN